MRDGKSYCQRQVDVWQDEATQELCFTSICAFKKPEATVNDRQHDVAVGEKYAAALAGRQPTDFEPCPGVDSPYYWARGQIDRFPGLEMRKADLSAYNAGRGALDKRQLHYYRVVGDMPASESNLHAAAHLYASDRNGLFPVPNFVGVGDAYSSVASLSHTVVFHVEADGLSMAELGADGVQTPRWFNHEIQVERIAHGRGLVRGTCRRDSDGLHVYTHYQDGQIRMGAGWKTAAEVFSDASAAISGKAKGKL